MNYLGQKEPDSTKSEFLEPVIYHMRHWRTLWQDHLNVEMTSLKLFAKTYWCLSGVALSS